MSVDACLLLRSSLTRGNTQQASSLLNADVVSMPSDSAPLLLHVAVRGGHPAAVRLLLSHGYPLNELSSEVTALHVAVDAGNFLLCQLLLEAGADPNLRDSVGLTPLHKAAQLSKGDICTLLVAGGADSCVSDFQGRSPAYWWKVGSAQQNTPSCLNPEITDLRAALLAGAAMAERRGMEPTTSVCKSAKKKAKKSEKSKK